MALSADDQATLTQFAEPPAESKSSHSFLSRLLGRDRDDVNEKPQAIAYTPTRKNKVSFSVAAKSTSVDDTEGAYPNSDVYAESQAAGSKRRVIREELGTFPNVLGRLSSILEKKSSSSEGFRPYKDSEFRQSWMPDSSCKECYDCGNKFTTFIRRHHCRICGQIFCSSCCNQEVPGRVMGFEGGLRACTYCCGVVTRLLEGSDDGDLGTLRDNLQAQLSNSSTNSTDFRTSGSQGSFTPRRLSVSDSFEPPSTRIASVFDIAPVPEPMQDMTSEERQSLVKTQVLDVYESMQDCINLPADTQVLDVYESMPDCINLPADTQVLDVYESMQDCINLPADTQDSLQLKVLFFEMLDPKGGVPLSSKRYRLRTHHDCFHGVELKNWLIDHDKAQGKAQAHIIGQALLDAKYVRCSTDPHRSNLFSNYSLYQFRPLTHSEVQSGLVRRLSLYPESLEDVPGWVQELEQSDLHVEASADFGHSVGASTISNMTSGEFRERSKSHLQLLEATYESDTKTNVTPTTLLSKAKVVATAPSKQYPGSAARASPEQISTKEVIHGYEPITLHPGDKESPSQPQQSADSQQNINHDQFKCLYNEHILKLCTELLERNHLPLTWANIVMRLSNNVSHFVRADVSSNQDQMSIASYVHIKKVRSGQPCNSDVTYGVICTKSAIHKKMKTSIRSPQIMLLQSSIEYQRVTNKFSSLDPQILQEREYLQNCVSKICKYKPDVLLVEGTVSRVAQELLLDSGITVVINVKSSVMKRAARMTMADVIPSIDVLISRPQLGTCYRFQTDLYRFHDGYYKTLMVFSGCPANLGCTVVLRGENNAELVKVKPILLMAIQACYHAKLELSLLNDLSAVPPSDKVTAKRGRHPSAESKDSFDAAILTKSPDAPKSNESIPTSPANALQHGSHGTSESRFCQVLAQVTLDYSPFIKVVPPYTETERGRLSLSRSGVPLPTFISPLLSHSGEPEGGPAPKARGSNELYAHRLEKDCMESLTTELRDPHELVTCNIDCSVNRKKLKDLQASYMASGGRIVMKSKVFHEKGMYREGENSGLSKSEPDCFNISLHQRISVLFSSYTLNSSMHSCVKPWIVPMKFYGKNDLTFGQFLEVYCFLPTYMCPRVECEVSMLEHIRKFVHGTGSLYLIVRRISQPEDGQENSDVITTWSWCRKCKKVTVMLQATAVVPLAPSTWHLSFARYLQLRLTCTLTGNQLSEDCVHSISRDYFQYFRQRDVVATFRYYSVTVREILFPSTKLAVRHTISKKDVTSQVGIIHTHGLGLFSELLETLYKLESCGLDTEEKKNLLFKCKMDLEEEKSWFTEKVYHIQTKLLEEPLPMGSELSHFRALNSPEYAILYQLDNDIIDLKCYLSRAVQQWNIRLDLASSKDERFGEKRQKSESGVTAKTAKALETQTTAADVPETSSGDPGGAIQSAIDEQIELSAVLRQRSSSSESVNDTLPLGGCDEQVLAHYHNSISHGLRAGVQRAATLVSNAGSVDSSFVVCGTPDGAPTKFASSQSKVDYSPGTPIDSASSASQSVTASGLQSSSLPVLKSPAATTKTSVSAFFDELPSSNFAHDIAQSASTGNAIEGVGSEELVNFSFGSSPVTADQADTNSNQCTDNEIAEDLRNSEEAVNVGKRANARQLNKHMSANAVLQSVSHAVNNKKGKTSKKARSFKDRVLAPSEDVITPIENPFSDNEHYLLRPTVNGSAIIYDEEPSSIIAYALGSQAYEEHMMQSKKNDPPVRRMDNDPGEPLPEKASVDSGTDSIEAVLKLTSISSIASSLKSFRSSGSAARNPPTVDCQDSFDWANLSSSASQTHAEMQNGDVDPFRFGKPKDPNDAALTSNQHFEMQFTEKSVSDEKMSLFYCKVYFAAKFKQLRQLVFADGERHFIRSLSRCYKWNAKGGKSGLGFCKTKDEMFLIKQMGRQEIQSFVEFGPHYFDYLINALSPSTTAKPKCALAKILGVYRIGLKNFETNAVFKQDVLVIENLFYRHRMGKVFDLKGSDRNRLAKKEAITDPVLLDENFMKYSKQNPIYIREHGKRVLMEALVHDSQFLAKHTVMDYSLLCGYDEDSKELVIGIIDYIRTFTWDKKLETYVKSSGILGGQGKMPTIVSPEVYRTRFLEAMDRYLNVVPDRWRDFACYGQQSREPC
ncbi:1-phosphatidylinositol 3-phosphate 5-kinase-like [Watersipora subatra]|uniref:1-phosphatidylinositol 3-phosphate 5-kinase-like n=1 Tax=Watersipora subatra TaxID=2589382 RepID=UPI00355C6DC6